MIPGLPAQATVNAVPGSTSRSQPAQQSPGADTPDADGWAQSSATGKSHERSSSEPEAHPAEEAFSPQPLSARRLSHNRTVKSPGTPAVRRVDFGYFVRPAEETSSGSSRVEPCLGYLVAHPAGLLLMDTGVGRHPEVEARYRPRRRALPAALADAGVRLDEVRLVVNCHLHLDHCGGNPELPRRPIFVQRLELATARNAEDYTLPELIDAPDLRYEELDGEAELLPGVLVVPTPGHTPGHQSLVVRATDGTVVVAGQSHDSASAYSADALAWRARNDGYPPPLPSAPAWAERLQQLDPARVVFAHDHAVWEP
jgi:N-acyl homoserine lactone hydrolase